MRDVSRLDIIWTDLETTGLDLDLSVICEIGWVRTDYKCSVIKEQETSLIALEDVDLRYGRASGAFQINGYDELAKYPESIEVGLTKWINAANGARLGGANNGAFDLVLLRKTLKNLQTKGVRQPELNLPLEKILGDYHYIDVCSVAAPLLVVGEIGNVSASSTLAEWAGLGVEPKPHVALYGAMQAMMIYRKLLERYAIN